MSLARQLFGTIVVDMSCLLYGMVAGWPSAALPLLQSDASPLGAPLSVEEGSWVGSVGVLSGLLGTPLFSLCVSRTGCKPAAYLVIVAMLLSWTLVLVGQHVAVLYTSRVMAGISGAGSFVVCGAYVRDIAEVSVRGALCSFLMISYMVGVLCSYLLPLIASYFTTAGLSLGLTAASLVALFWLPETPWFYLRRGRLEEAKASLKWYRLGKDEGELEAELSARAAAAEQTRLEEASRRVSLRDLVATRANRRALAVGLVACANMHLSGVIAVLSYAEPILAAAGSALAPSLSAVVLGAVLLAGVGAATLLADRAGRRPLLLASNAGVAASCAALGAHFFAVRAGAWSPGWLPLAALCVFVVAVSVGTYPVPYIVIAEVFSPRIRELANSVGLSLSWLVCFLVAKFYPTVAAAAGDHVCYWFFAASCTACGVFFAVVMPETKGRSLEEIQRDLEARTFCGSAPPTTEQPKAWLTFNGHHASLADGSKYEKDAGIFSVSRDVP